ncbi:uncharacterized protein LOC107646617 [Arachis ipaensis]|uniref:uncharacterized protein LOC107646617 n=1 Tax=Arachis ipaensis TaxID=130454 RepID=UPI0007AF3348|nr:uncharacterized protein LOC107646617 [Arachis ipaensis]
MPEATGNNPNPVDFMAALGNMAAAMQATAEALENQMNNENNGNNGDEDSMTLFSFLKVSEEQWVKFRTYQLQEFYKKYFLSSVRNAKELELLQLKQGQMTVTEYTSRIEELCHFSRIFQGAPEDFAEWKYIKYEGGLQSDILSFVAPMEIRVFSELVNKSRMAEECPGHLANNCPEKKKYETGRVQQPGRVYTTSAAGVEGSKTLIRGNCEMAGKILNALSDSGATHLFIAFEKADELGLKIVVLGYDLKVYNATHEAMVTRLECPQVPL